MVVWGFPIHINRIIAKFDTENPTEEITQVTTETFSKLSYTVRKMLGRPVGGNLIGPHEAYTHENGKLKKIEVMAIVKCTRRDDSFLPQPQEMEELKVFFKEGTFGEPGWFLTSE